MNQNYRHSGRFTIGGVVLGLLLGTATGIPLAFVYAWGLPLIPEAKLSCIATVIFGGSVGALTALGLKWGKTRNSVVAGIAAFSVATLALYCSWAFWVKNTLHTFAHREADASFLMFHPDRLWYVVKLINRYGTWGLSGGSPEKGTMLWIVWAVEALAVLGLAALAAVAIIRHIPFCETCDRWCKAHSLFLTAADDLAQLKTQIQNRDFSFLSKFAAGSKRGSHLAASLYTCPSCNQLNTLTLRQTEIAKRKFGSPRMKSVSLANNLIVNQQEADAFRHASLRLGSAKANAATAG